MTGTTLTGLYTYLKLDSSLNPVTFDGTVTSDLGVAIVAPAGPEWSITNSGVIAGDPHRVTGYGIYLKSVGAITNLSGGSITGVGGVFANGNGELSITNSGYVAGTGIGIQKVNLGVTNLTNELGGMISGGFAGINLNQATVVNYGTISATSGVGAGLSDGIITNSSGAAITGHESAIFISYTYGGVRNAGMLSALGPGVHFAFMGSLTNGSTGTITSTQSAGIYAYAGMATVVNSGEISGGGSLDGKGAAIALLAGGYVTNEATGTIHAANDYGIYATGNGTITNAGVILDGGAGDFAIAVRQGAFITNASNGTIAGPGGIIAKYGVVTNAGTIIGTASGAVDFTGSYGDTVIVDPGAVFEGQVDGGPAQHTMLELYGGNTQGTLNGIGTQIVNFQTILAVGNAGWFVSGSAAGFAAALVELVPADTLEITGFVETGITVTGTTVELSSLAGPLTLDIASASRLSASTDGINTFIDVACFATGTRIRTPHDETAVENLSVGESVLTTSGAAKRIRWIGHRPVDCRRHPRPWDVWPVRVHANALGVGRPGRDVWLSPDHAVFLDDVLIPIRCLINGRTIEQEPRDNIAYWHVELDCHDVILAEGLPCESYLDTGNRSAFENGGSVVQIHPNFVVRLWDGDACAPLVIAGPQLDQVRANMPDRMWAPAEISANSGVITASVASVARTADPV